MIHAPLSVVTRPMVCDGRFKNSPSSVGNSGKSRSTARKTPLPKVGLEKNLTYRLIMVNDSTGPCSAVRPHLCQWAIVIQSI
jgi:hypothetical protein